MPDPPPLWTPGNELWIPTPGDDPLLAGAKAAAAEVFGGAGAGEPEPLTEYANDPNAYWVDVLHERPWKGRPGVPGQFELNQMLLDEPFIAAFAGTGPGKTYWVSRAIHWWMMTHRNALAFWLAPTWEQVINQIGRHLRAVHAKAQRNHGVPGRAIQTKLDISDRWFASGMSPKDPQNIAGYHADTEISEQALAARARWLEMTNEEFFAAAKVDGHEPAVLVVEDEASQIDDEVQDAADGLLTGPGCRRIKLGNLTSERGRFVEVWKGWTPQTANLLTFEDEETDEARERRLALAARIESGEVESQARNEVDGDGKPSWRTVRWTAFDAPDAIVARGFVERMRRDCGPNYEANPRYMARVLALPPTGSDMAIFPLSLLEACSEIRPGRGGRHMGVDLGYGGGDPCVATLTVDGRVASIFEWQVEGPVLDLEDTYRVIRSLAEGPPLEPGEQRTNHGWNVPAAHVHVDASEAGGKGVVQIARRRGFYIDGVSLGEAAKGDWFHVLGHPPHKLKTRRQELLWVLQRLLQDGQFGIPDDPRFERIRAQLSAIYWHEKGLDGFQAEPKKRTIARLGRSPDDADSVLVGLSRVNPASLRIATVKRRRGARVRRLQFRPGGG